jgi:hypothetical protein
MRVIQLDGETLNLSAISLTFPYFGVIDTTS